MHPIKLVFVELIKKQMKEFASTGNFYFLGGGAIFSRPPKGTNTTRKAPKTLRYKT
jgi:hypothetical protein